MKIGIDIRCLAEEKYSGISEYCYNLVDYLTKNDPKNHYVLFYNHAKGKEINFFAERPNVSYRAFSYPNKLFNLSLRFLKWPKVDKLIGGVDVFIVPNFLFLSLSDQCKKILIVHDLSFEIFPEFFTFKKRLWHRLIGPKKWCLSADSIVAISQNTKQDLVDIYDINPDKISVIYPGVADHYFQPITDQSLAEVKDKYNLPFKYFLHVGNIEPRKNLETSLRAFELLKDPDVHFVIAGNLAWKYHHIRDLAAKLSKADKIKFLGYVDAQDKQALYHSALALVYPSIYEGFGLPPVEAMASGAPVISGANSSLLESVGQAGILVDVYNINDLAKAMEIILTDRKTALAMKESGKLMSQNFTWQRASFEIKNLIDKNNENRD